VGGGLQNDGGTATISTTTVAGNTSYEDGGGIRNSGTLTLRASTLSGNTASGRGGGLYSDSTAAVSTSTIANNAAGTGGGGGIFNGGTLTVQSSTIANNTTSDIGGGISNGVTDFWAGGTLNLGNSIVAGNTDAVGAPDLYGSLASSGYNLIGDGSGVLGGTAPTDLVGYYDGASDIPIDALLGPLQNNGGPTQTMALLPGSPALNAGDPTQLGTPDQRSVVRTGGVNIGAYQASATAFVLSAPASTLAGMPFTLTVTAVDAFGQVAIGYGGTIHCRSSDPAAKLPADYTFTVGDNGVHVFVGLVLRTKGRQSLTATDALVNAIAGSVTELVL
jgi:hypothetical protein